MEHKQYSVYDSKAEVYTLPFFMTTEAQAIRQFSNWINSRTHTFGLNPEDYTLFATGIYEDTTGTITQDKIVSIGNGLQFIKNEDTQ